MKIKNSYLKFVLTLGLFFFGSLLQWIPIALFHLDLNNISQNQQILLTIFSNTIIMLIIVKMFWNDLKKDFISLKKKFLPILSTSFNIWVIGLCIMAASNWIINQLSSGGLASNEEAIRSMIQVSPFLMLLNTALLAPVLEELVFRKSFREVFHRPLIYILTSGLVFGGLHVFFNINSLFDYLYLIPYCSLGISFSYIYYKTDNIWASICMHSFHNAIITILNIIGVLYGK